MDFSFYFNTFVETNFGLENNQNLEIYNTTSHSCFGGEDNMVC